MLLRALEIFGGPDCCPVCKSPPKWKAGKIPKDKERQDLHDDRCLLDIMIGISSTVSKAPVFGN